MLIMIVLWNKMNENCAENAGNPLEKKNKASACCLFFFVFAFFKRTTLKTLKKALYAVLCILKTQENVARVKRPGVVCCSLCSLLPDLLASWWPENPAWGNWSNSPNPAVLKLAAPKKLTLAVSYLVLLFHEKQVFLKPHLRCSYLPGANDQIFLFLGCKDQTSRYVKLDKSTLSLS